MRKEPGARVEGGSRGSPSPFSTSILFVFLYAFTTEEASFQFPPPGFTTDWFGVAWQNPEIRAAEPVVASRAGVDSRRPRRRDAGCGGGVVTDSSDAMR